MAEDNDNKDGKNKENDVSKFFAICFLIFALSMFWSSFFSDYQARQGSQPVTASETPDKQFLLWLAVNHGRFKTEGEARRAWREAELARKEAEKRLKDEENYKKLVEKALRVAGSNSAEPAD